MRESPPDGYSQPRLVYLVEHGDDREPGQSFQAGGFTTEEEAQRLVDRLTDAGYVELTIHIVAIHERVEDWEFDR